MDPVSVSAVLFLDLEAYGVKGHPYTDVLKIYRQMGPLQSKPLALFGLSP